MTAPAHRSEPVPASPSTPDFEPVPASDSAPASASASASAPAPDSVSVSVSVSVNGAVRPLAAGTTLEALVATLTAAPSGVAAAVNETVVPRGQWPTATLRDGDRVEVLTAVQGG
ncbi:MULTISPECIES: sulfur carrier protein ThiS [unclassified Streptomyces]|uniref:sulfur carrier protein ThiS n=1 Tax=unclassified Streptomyces TaxID=2593676 RepID=UPI0036E4A5EB